MMNGVVFYITIHSVATGYGFAIHPAGQNENAVSDEDAGCNRAGTGIRAHAALFCQRIDRGTKVLDGRKTGMTEANGSCNERWPEQVDGREDIYESWHRAHT